jgi:hypothetical protein
MTNIAIAMTPQQRFFITTPLWTIPGSIPSANEPASGDPYRRTTSRRVRVSPSARNTTK